MKEENKNENENLTFSPLPTFPTPFTRWGEGRCSVSTPTDRRISSSSSVDAVSLRGAKKISNKKK